MASLNEGEIISLMAIVTPEDSDNTSLIWSSTDETVATVDQNGFVTAIAEGNTTVTVITNDGGFEAWTVITVLSLGESNVGKDPIVYPNPTSGILQLDLSPYSNKETNIFVFNELQQLVYTKKFPQDHLDTEEIDIGQFSVGAYYMVFETDTDREGKIFLIRK